MLKNTHEPLISLIIPTRERANTLLYTLETAINQKTTSYEIIVSDNCSSDNTKEVVKKFTDSRIKYLNTGRRLSMCDNWDFAVEHAKGEYIIIIGDDDGVMPDAIDKLQSLINRRKSNVYYWQFPEYYWPIDDNPAFTSYLGKRTEPFEIDLKKRVRFAVKWGAWRYGSLPLVYHAAVAKCILDAIKAKTGRIFHSTCPDVFMGFALPVFADTAIDVGEAMTVSGRSAKSNSGSFTAKGGDTVVQRFVDEYSDYKLHRTLYPRAPFSANTYGDSVLVAMDLFPEYYRGMRFNYSAMWAHTVRVLKKQNIVSVIKQRSEIRNYQPFSVTKFLFYMLIHRILAFRVALRRKFSNKKVRRLADQYPKNIRDFVLLLVRQQSP